MLYLHDEFESLEGLSSRNEVHLYIHFNIHFSSKRKCKAFPIFSQFLFKICLMQIWEKHMKNVGH